MHRYISKFCRGQRVLSSQLHFPFLMKAVTQGRLIIEKSTTSTEWYLWWSKIKLKPRGPSLLSSLIDIKPEERKLLWGSKPVPKTHHHENTMNQLMHPIQCLPAHSLTKLSMCSWQTKCVSSNHTVTLAIAMYLQYSWCWETHSIFLLL